MSPGTALIIGLLLGGTVAGFAVLIGVYLTMREMRNLRDRE
jgi:hypothetical protein